MKVVKHTSIIILVGLTPILILVTACKSSYKNLKPLTGASQDCIENFKPHFTRSLYNTQVDILKQHLSGVLFIKQMPDSSTRIVFSTETGFKFFDFEFKEDGGFRVYYILDKMNRKKVIEMLQEDFSLLLMNRNSGLPGGVLQQDSLKYHRIEAGNYTQYYITNIACSQLLRAEATAGKRPFSTIVYQPYSLGLPDSAFISHRGIKFNIALKRLETATIGN